MYNNSKIYLTICKFVQKRGISLPILLDKQHFSELFTDLNIVTGLKISFFDENFNPILSHPKEDCKFCSLIKNNPYGNLKCTQAIKNAFLKCQKTKKDFSFTCNAGLCETVIPIIEAEKIIGYVLFGQTAENKDFSFLWEICKSLGIERQAFDKASSSLNVMSKNEISSACQIIKMCVQFRLFSESISASRSQQITAFKEYISNNLSSELTVSKICKQLNVSRTTLYELVKEELGTGISEYITLKRIQRAKKLLLSTNMSIAEIAEAVGIYDYNYFSKYFKAKTGLSPSKWRTLT
ncbi:MAG: helix-turn-helix domain-containing protein [Ruminococcaceae bacterium]|nr:helix-turn-helix domain-containing protein [Oscillospiraceae bacterium]